MKKFKDIESAYWDNSSDPEILRDWLMDNEFDSDADKFLRELRQRTASHVSKASDDAFGKFVESTGISRVSGWMRFKSTCIRVCAALLVPVAAVAVFALVNGRNANVEWNQLSTSYGESRNLTLADGTSVRLGACTKVIYPDHFVKGERKIFVTGDAYLDVAKDPDRPFVVEAGSFDVIVHGTRFNLRSYSEDKEDELALMEGSVSLRFPDNMRNVEMRPGEMVRYNKADGSISRKTFSINYFDEILRSDGLCFENMQLSDITSVLAKRFGKTIIIEDSSISSERYYASFINNESLDEILSTLNTRNYLSIIKDGDAVRIFRRK